MVETGENIAISVPEGGVKYCWHIVTCEYPPQTGGVGDYTHLMAEDLAAHEDEVHVWCPSHSAEPARVQGVTVHQLGSISPRDLRRVDTELEGLTAPHRLIIQWVPHGYRYRSMNLAFCWWLYQRALRHRDEIDLIVHEPYLPFRAWALRQNAAALVHRLMAILILRAARRVWVTIPGWEGRLRPYALKRQVPFQWLPIFSNIPVVHDPERIAAIRRTYIAPGQLLIGHFGTFGREIAGMLGRILSTLGPESDLSMLLVGQHSDEYRETIVRRDPRFGGVVHATGQLTPSEISCHLSACDLMIQPYADGVSCRRGSFMAGLSHGKPIVTTVGELSEPFWSHCDAVALVPATNIEGFARSILRLCADAAERRRLGAAAGELYSTRFDLRHAVAALRHAEASRESACAF